MCNFRGGSTMMTRSAHADSFTAGCQTHRDGLGSSTSIRWRMGDRPGWLFADTITDRIRCTDVFCLLAISWRQRGTQEKSPACHGRHSSRTSRSPMTPWSVTVNEVHSQEQKVQMLFHLNQDHQLFAGIIQNDPEHPKG